MGNRYDEVYDIRLANYGEIDEVMQFINDEWRANHIMSRNRELFEHEFVRSGKVCVMIAKNRTTGQIEGMLGYIPASSDAKPDAWGSMWKAKEKSLPFLGVEIGKRVIFGDFLRYEMGIGVNRETASPLLKKIFKQKEVRLKHFYILKDLENYTIAKIVHKKFAKIDENQQTHLIREITSREELEREFDTKENVVHIPYKDNDYIAHRYLEHPIYKYELYGIYDDDMCKAILSIRKQECNGSCVYRVMDYIGSHSYFAYLGKFFNDLLEEAEYVDMYCYGMDDKLIKQAGFIERLPEDENVIPNFFSPFEQKNVEIWALLPTLDTVCFKADSDQDRPN